MAMQAYTDISVDLPPTSEFISEGKREITRLISESHSPATLYAAGWITYIDEIDVYLPLQGPCRAPVIRSEGVPHQNNGANVLGTPR